MKTKVACIGDSITELSDYPNHAKQILGENYSIGNFGACGTTVSLDSETPYMQSQAFAGAKEFMPDIAVVMLGTNDANLNLEGNRSYFVADYLVLLGAVKSFASKPKVWVVKPPHVFDEAWLSGRIQTKEVIPGVTEAAERAALPVIDVYSATDNPSLFLDGVHPDVEGAEIIAQVICQVIRGK